MDTFERKQIRLILDNLVSENLRTNQNRQRAMHAANSAAGKLRFGNTVGQAIEIIEEQATEFINAALSDVGAVATGPAAFSLISKSLERVLEGYKLTCNEAVRLATGGPPSRSPGVAQRADGLLAEIRERAFRRLAIARFDFVKATDGPGAVRVQAVTEKANDLLKKRNPGGKPLAAHWDAMWAAIAVKLWSGELNPKSQADVKKAMINWFNEAEIDIGDTALTQRARQLWQAMQDADS